MKRDRKMKFNLFVFEMKVSGILLEEKKLFVCGYVLGISTICVRNFYYYTSIFTLHYNKYKKTSMLFSFQPPNLHLACDVLNNLHIILYY